MNHCSHCDIEIPAGEICNDCLEAGHTISGKCEACRQEAAHTCLRIAQTESDNIDRARMVVGEWLES